MFNLCAALFFRAFLDSLGSAFVGGAEGGLDGLPSGFHPALGAIFFLVVVVMIRAN